MRRLVSLIAVLFGFSVVLGGCPDEEKEEEKPAEETTTEPEKPALKEVAEAEPNEKTDQAMDSCTASSIANKSRRTGTYRHSPLLDRVRTP